MKVGINGSNSGLRTVEFLCVCSFTLLHFRERLLPGDSTKIIGVGRGSESYISFYQKADPSQPIFSLDTPLETDQKKPKKLQYCPPKIWKSPLHPTYNGTVPRTTTSRYSFKFVHYSNDKQQSLE